MVRADKCPGITGRLRADERAAMPADVVEALDRPIPAAQNDDRIGIHLESKVIAGLWDFTAMPGENPTLPPNALQIGAIDTFVGVKRAGQRPTGAILRSQRRYLIRGDGGMIA